MHVVRTILHPSDRSEASEYAHRVARLIARDCGARLIVLQIRATDRDESPHATDPYPFPFVLPDELEDCLADLRGHLDETAGTEAEVRASVCLKAEDLAEQILRTAREFDPLMIILGSHERGGPVDGLVANAVGAIMKQAGCPVLAVKHPNPPSPPRQSRKAVSMNGLAIASHA